MLSGQIFRYLHYSYNQLAYYSRVGWNNTTIKAVETTGAASFAAAKSAGRVVSLSKIDTIATTLGALAVTPATLETSIKTGWCLIL